MHIAKLSGGTFCGNKRIDILNTVTYAQKEYCTCKNCLRVVRKLEKALASPTSGARERG